MLDESVPPFRLLFVNPEAEVAQHLGGASLADADVHGALIESRFGGRKPRHRGQEGDADVSCRVRYRHAVGRPAVGLAERTAVEGLLVRVVELESADPALVGGHTLDEEVDADVAGGLPAVFPPHVPHAHPAPQQIRVGYRDRHEVAAVDGHAGTLFWRALAGSLLVPALEARVPQSQRLHRGGLSRVVRADEDHRVAELDLDLAEALEVPDGELRQHRSSQFAAIVRDSAGSPGVCAAEVSRQQTPNATNATARSRATPRTARVRLARRRSGAGRGGRRDPARASPTRRPGADGRSGRRASRR